MASADLIVALVALAASIVALLISTTQLFAEIFATAEGRRKTSLTVMGPFGKLSEKSLKLTELRFEIHYISPHLVSSLPERLSPRERLRQLEKDRSLYYDTFYAIDGPAIERYVKVRSHWRNHGWQILFHNIRESLMTTREYGEAPTIELRDRAWDELPDDVGGPVASTELFDILVIARRMGAIWQRFDSLSDVLRAEGNGHVFFSTEIRGLGRALSYQYVGPAKKEIKTKSKLSTAVTSRQVTRHWNSDAIKFMFGVCPGNVDFDLRDYVIREMNDLKMIWNHYGYLELPWQRVDGKEKRWKDLFKEKIDIELRHATNDLIALNCPMIRPGPSSPERFNSFQMGQVLLPFAGNFENMFQGLSLDRDIWGRTTFLRLFKHNLGSITSTQKERLDRIVRIATRLADGNIITNAIKLSDASDLLDEALNGYMETTCYFRELGGQLPDSSKRITDGWSKEQSDNSDQAKSNEFYFHLMRAHLSKSPLVHGDAQRNYKDDRDRERAKVRNVKDRIRCEQVHLLFDSIDYFQDFMEKKGFQDRNLVKEAWMVLFFRGMCWSLCHTSDEEGSFLPAEFYGSRMPIFLI